MLRSRFASAAGRVPNLMSWASATANMRSWRTTNEVRILRFVGFIFSPPLQRSDREQSHRAEERLGAAFQDAAFSDEAIGHNLPVLHDFNDDTVELTRPATERCDESFPLQNLSSYSSRGP